MGQNFVDDVDCGNFFDHIDDFIEFPPDSECSNGLLGSGDCKDIPSIWNEAIGDGNPLFTGYNSNSASDLSAELSVPYEDIIPLEWLSTFVEDSFSGSGMTLPRENSFVNQETSLNKFHTSSPVSVLESSSSSSSSSSSNSGMKTNPVTPNHRGIQRARSKRPRPATFSLRPSIQLIFPNSSFGETHPHLVSVVSSEYENVGESQPTKKLHEPHAMEGQKKIKPKMPLGPIEINQNAATQAARKCLHCEITKTPQWRAGPMGPKTLCNACGVRYKSGRLFPEYRPAASPTFVPSLHSNSHKKVVEMRNKLLDNKSVEGTAASVPISSPGNIIRNSNLQHNTSQ